MQTPPQTSPTTPPRANPLLDFSSLPRFDAVRPEHMAPAIAQLLAEAEAALHTVTAPGFAAQWQALAQTLDVATERLARAWGTVSHLSSVADTPALRAAYNAALPSVTAFWTRLGADDKLYALYQAIDEATLTPEQARARSNALRGFRLGGAQLQGAARERFAAIQQRQAELSQKFSENVLDATDGWSYLAQAHELQGVPPDVVQAARAAAKADAPARAQGLAQADEQAHEEANADAERYKLTLKMPCYLPVMQSARHRPLRERLYRAYTTRASDQAPGDLARFDNSAIIAELLALRHEEAALLGYANFAELSLVPKMADSPEQVMQFLRDLAARARPFAERDLAELRTFAAEHLGLPDLQAWDIAYASEQLKQARYAFSEQEVKQYLPAPRVLAGLFHIIETLFDVHIRPEDERVPAHAWHPGVRLYRIERASAQPGQPPALLGQFYLDPGARAGKRGGAWMDDVRARWLRPDNATLQTPVAHLVCNFAEGSTVDGVAQPPLLTHDDVITLFHEAGHGLHHLLTQVSERDVSGISGVEWDAVELPSQFMENFCWEWSVLRPMTAHVQTGQPLPRALFDKMHAAKNFQSGLTTLRQIEFALFDMRLHAQYATHAGDVQALLQDVRREVAVLTPPAFSRSAHSFSHIFAGGYAAGYYSYKWAEVLSADAWAAFEETARPDANANADAESDADADAALPFNPETGRRYRQHILEVGGSRPAMQSFIAFRGRAPTLDALLRQQGMGTA